MSERNEKYNYPHFYHQENWRSEKSLIIDESPEANNRQNQDSDSALFYSKTIANVPLCAEVKREGL